MLLHVCCNSWEINSKGEQSNEFVLANTRHLVGAVVQLAEYRTRNQEVEQP